MGAKISFIFAAETADVRFLRRAIADLTPEIRRVLGTLKSVLVHDFESNTIRESMLGASPSDDIPRFSENEIVTLYPDNIQNGCVMLTSEGRFMVITIALRRVSNPLEFLMECWRKIGGELSAALMGEELEVREKELDSLIREVRIPREADLCEAAIVTARVGTTTSIVGTGVEHGAVLLRS